jgi:phosphatidylglycerophosphatase A
MEPSRESFVGHLAVLIATWGGVGRVPIAPGTAGTLAAVPLFPLLAALRASAPLLHGLAVMALLGAAVWAAGAASRAFAEPDSGRIVIDEVSGYVVATAFLEFSWLAAAIAFALFRLFDVVKPFPVSWVDRHVHGGLGVVGDDVLAGVLAGVATKVVLAVL